jgi:conjugative transfer region protein TrbK
MRAIGPLMRGFTILLGLALLAVAACTVQLRPAEDASSAATPTLQNSDPLAAKLEQCRAVTAEQTTALDECRQIWTENRRRFLGQQTGKPPESSLGQATSTPLQER